MLYIKFLSGNVFASYRLFSNTYYIKKKPHFLLLPKNKNHTINRESFENKVKTK